MSTHCRGDDAILNACGLLGKWANAKLKASKNIWGKMHEVGEINTINMKYLWHLFCLMKVTDNAHYVALHLDFVTVSWNLNNQSPGEHPSGTDLPNGGTLGD